MWEAWLEAEQGRFALFLPVFMAAGVILYFALPSEPPLWPFLLAAPAGVALGLASGLTWGRGALLAVAFFAAGMASARLAAGVAAPWDAVPRHAVVAEGNVLAVEALAEGRRVTLGVVSLDGGAKLARAVRLRLREDDGSVIAAGDRLRVRALLRPPPVPAYPGGWDMRRDAFFGGMGAYGFALGSVERLSSGAAPRWQGLREAIAARVTAALPGERGAIAAVLLTGLGAAIPKAERQDFQDSGLAHLLAVAGLHVGIVMGLFFGLARYGLAAIEPLALRWDLRRVGALVSLAAGGAYLALTGAHVPILRSFAMASLVALGVLTGRRAVSLRALAIAAAAVMLIEPEAVMGVSFQMSFAAVLALAAGYEALRPVFARAPEGWPARLGLYALGLVTTSFLAGTASLPFACYHFGRAALFYVPANLVAVPLTAFWVMPWCLAALFLMPFHAEVMALVPAGWGIAGLIGIARVVAAWPGAVLPVRQLPPAAILLMAAGLAWLGLWRSRLRLAGGAAIVAGLALAWVWPAPDLVVGPDARVIAARVGETVLVEAARGASAFEREIPLRVWGREGAAFPEAGEAASGRVRCSAAFCDLALAGGVARLWRDPDRPPECGGASLMLAGLSLDGACSGVPLLDRSTVWRSGAAAVRMGEGGPEIRFADGAAARPWLQPPPRERPALPPALTE